MPNEPQESGNQATAPELSPGVKLLRTLAGHTAAVRSVAFGPKGHTLVSGGADGTVQLWELHTGQFLSSFEEDTDWVRSLAFDPKGRTLASGGVQKTVQLWNPRNVKRLRCLEGHLGTVLSLAFDPQGRTLASGSGDRTVLLWDQLTGKLLHSLRGHNGGIYSVAFDSQGLMLASGSADGTVRLWESHTGQLLRSLEEHTDWVRSVAFDPQGRMLASSSDDRTVRLWEPHTGQPLHSLEGHLGPVECIAFSSDGTLLASKSSDHTIRLWRCDTWEQVAVIPEPAIPGLHLAALAFHPAEPLLATSGSVQDTPQGDHGKLIHLYELDLTTLLERRSFSIPSVYHTTARIVLVGDSGVGKTGLGWRLAHGKFKEHASTHGQQFWVCDELGARRADGTKCEAVLWDLAGQPDYRLIHSLFLDDADLALVLFDPTHASDPLRGVEFWLQQLRGTPTLLVAARCDRGDGALTAVELEAFCVRRGLAGYVRTSASTGDGLDDLLARMKSLIPWEKKPTTVTTVTFKKIKDYMLELKQSGAGGEALVSAEELRMWLGAADSAWSFGEEEILTAVGHLETYGYVKRLRTSKGEQRILLAPELLNNLAASFVLEARRNPRGLGAIEEKRLLDGGCDFPELKGLPESARTILLDAAMLLFLEHHVCFRETPLNEESLLMFPELINLKRPVEEEKPVEEGTAYTVNGAVENVFASLVVLLGYTQTFTRTLQWQNNARYEVSGGAVCGFRQETERDGGLNFALCFSTDASRPVRMIFQGLFESFLARRNLTVLRYEPVVCGKCRHALDRAVVRQRLKEGKTFAFCNDCGKRLALAKEEPIQLSREQQSEVEEQRRAADVRTRFEQAVFRVQAFATEQKIKAPECFISYAWGDQAHERWVEKSLATDLQKAGIAVVLDRWENARIGASVMRFVERADECDCIVVVGTPLYRRKAKNLASDKGSVVAAEYDVAGIRLLGSEKMKQTVFPVLVEGDAKTAFPVMLRGKVYADFRNADGYFIAAFNLILSLYGIPPHHAAVADLVESLKPEQDRLRA